MRTAQLIHDLQRTNKDKQKYVESQENMEQEYCHKRYEMSWEVRP